MQPETLKSSLVPTLETTMDNFLLQALLESTGAKLAFSNGWRYGAPVLPGKVTLNDLYNIIPMNPPISTVELTGEEIVAMLEENLERTFARDPYDQMGGYVKRGLGFNAYIKNENPRGQNSGGAFVALSEGSRQFGLSEGGKEGAEGFISALLKYMQQHLPS